MHGQPYIKIKIVMYAMSEVYRKYILPSFLLHRTSNCNILIGSRMRFMLFVGFEVIVLKTANENFVAQVVVTVL